MTKEEFPNGIDSWRETHFEVVQAILVHFCSGVFTFFGVAVLISMADSELTSKNELVIAFLAWLWMLATFIATKSNS